ncbi:MAG TPA: carboxypeptidase-like regulatory domain-containing protein, partial [Pyrinomonadaceae bacterium]|nr:carboxypeptidase-like regulatory domain-containing protein [Pyrinomonadaceae bacterium]
MKIAKTLLLASFVLCWTIDVKPQTEDKPKGSTVRGVVVYSDTGRPLRHARITIFGDSRFQVNTASDLRGRFEFENVRKGKYRLTVEAPGLLTPYSNVARVKTFIPDPVYPDIDELTTQFTVNGTDSVNLKIKAVRGGVITGKVVNKDDQPVPHAEIRLLRRENNKWVPLWSTWTRHDEDPQSADATGVYRIAGLPSGDYVVRASEPSVRHDDVPGDEDTYSNGFFVVAYHPAATRLKNAQAVTVVAGSESTGIDIRMAEQAPHTLTGTVKLPFLKEIPLSVTVTIERSDEAGFSTAIQNSTTGAVSGTWRVS